MKAQIKITKTSTFGTYDHKEFWLRAPNGRFYPMTEEELARKTAYKQPTGWIASENATNFEHAIELHREGVKQAQAERKAKNEEREKREQSQISELLKLDVIPVTAQNLYLVMKHLNGQNWGSWALPKMSVGYSAHQYDCDGKLATTIQLAEPMEGEKRFSFGAPRGHLSKYSPIEMFI